MFKKWKVSTNCNSWIIFYIFLHILAFATYFLRCYIKLIFLDFYVHFQLENAYIFCVHSLPFLQNDREILTEISLLYSRVNCNPQVILLISVTRVLGISLWIRMVFLCTANKVPSTLKKHTRPLSTTCVPLPEFFKVILSFFINFTVDCLRQLKQRGSWFES
jgi:hypothetical protein